LGDVCLGDILYSVITLVIGLYMSLDVSSLPIDLIMSQQLQKDKYWQFCQKCQPYTFQKYRPCRPNEVEL